METIKLQIQRQASGMVNTDFNVIFETLINSDGAVVYNSVTGEIVINKTGRYTINWWVATQTALGSNNIVFSLESSEGDDLIGNSPIKQTEVVGVAIVQVDSTPFCIKISK